VSDLREQIRSLLREELAALRGAATQPARLAVQIENDHDLLHFARDLLARAQDPDFVADVNAGRVRFTLEHRARAAPMSALVTSAPTRGSWMLSRLPRARYCASAKMSWIE